MSESPLSSSLPTEIPVAPPSAPRRRRGGSWLAWGIALALGAMVLAVEGPNEMTRWKVAAALEAREAGEKKKAYELLAEASERDPSNDKYKTTLAEWKLEDRDYPGALLIAEELCASEPNNPQLLSFRSMLYQHLGQHDKAIEDLLTIKRMSAATGQPDRAQSLNNLAYARAVGKTDLDQALTDVEQAIRLTETELATETKRLKTLSADKHDTGQQQLKVLSAGYTLGGYLDTRGLVQLHRGELQSALADFNRAISLTEKFLSVVRANRGISTHDRTADARKNSQEQIDKSVAVLYYHRYLACQKLGREAEAQKNFAKAKELLGREPDESLF